MSDPATFKWVFERPVNATWDLPVTRTVMESPKRLERVVAVVAPASEANTVGPGFKLVGSEIRYDFSSLTGV
jgi:hypothetical protein